MLPTEALDLSATQGILRVGAEFTLYFICLRDLLRCGFLLNNVKCYSVEGRGQKCIFLKIHLCTSTSGLSLLPDRFTGNI